MERQSKREICRAAGLLLAFALWTAAVCSIDVQAIGPQGSQVGLAALNGAFHKWTGVHMPLYMLTDWLSLIPIGFALAFALLGLIQWIRRRSLRKVDRSILVLGGFYAAVLAVYILFEMWAVNFRPVLIEGVLEASYPSSTTVLVLCMMSTAWMQLRARIKCTGLRVGVTVAMIVFSSLMIIGRLLSGVHWLTDIVGGGLLSAGLVMMYAALSGLEGQ